MFWLGLLLPISYIPQYTGMTVLTGWPILSAFLPFFFLRRVELTHAHWLGLVFLAYATLSLLWAEVKPQGVWDLWLLYCLAGCFMLGASGRDLRPLYKGLALGIGVSTILCIPQFFGWQGIYVLNSARPAGLFVNPDMLAESAVLVSVALLSVGVFWPLVLTIPPILFIESRTAWVAVAAVAIVYFWDIYRSKFVTMVMVLGLIAALAGIYAVKRADGDVGLRIAMWQDTISGLTFFGHGPGSFHSLYPEFASRTDTMALRPESAHNDFLELIFEFGLGTLPLFALFFWGGLGTSPSRYPLAAFSVIAFFSFPIRIPTEGIIGMVALGACCSDRVLSSWHGYPWRSVIASWPSRPRRASLPVESLYPNRTGVLGIDA